MQNQEIYTGAFAFFKKHLNGDYSLGRSYWINTFLILMIAPLIGIITLPWLSENLPARYSSTVFIFLTGFGIFAWIWAVSGTWASANKHVVRGGKQAWANAAKVMIILGAFRMVGEIGAITQPLKEHWDVAIGSQPGPDVIFQVRADGKSLLFKGGINDGSAEKLQNTLDIAPSITTVVLDSNGGWVREGNMIAKVISDRNLNTYVENECISACTIALLAGKDRAAEPNARIGFHSFKSIGVNDPLGTQADIESAKKVYRLAGLSESFIKRIIDTPSDEIWYLSNDELFAEGVFTRKSIGGETLKVVTTISSRNQLINDLKKIPAFDALSLKYPEEFETVINVAWAKIEARASDIEVMTAARQQVSQLWGKLLPIASDESLVEFVRFIHNQAVFLRNKNPIACSEIIFPTGANIDTASLFPPDLVAQEMALMNKFIRESDIRFARIYSDHEYESTAIRVFSYLTESQAEIFISAEKELRMRLPLVMQQLHILRY